MKPLLPPSSADGTSSKSRNKSGEVNTVEKFAEELPLDFSTWEEIDHPLRGVCRSSVDELQQQHIAAVSKPVISFHLSRIVAQSSPLSRLVMSMQSSGHEVGIDTLLVLLSKILGGVVRLRSGSGIFARVVVFSFLFVMPALEVPGGLGGGILGGDISRCRFRGFCGIYLGCTPPWGDVYASCSKFQFF